MVKAANWTLVILLSLLIGEKVRLCMHAFKLILTIDAMMVV